MAKPTLTPAQTTSVIILPENYTVPGAGAEKDSLINSFPFLMSYVCMFPFKRHCMWV